MTNSRKPSGWFWLVVLLTVAPIIYVLSFGPACLLVEKDMLPIVRTAEFYRPLVCGVVCDFRPVAAPLRWYAEIFAHKPEDSSGATVVDFMHLALTIEDKNRENQKRIRQRSRRRTSATWYPAAGDG